MGKRGLGRSYFHDGLSSTILIGEKHVPDDRFGQGWWDCSLYNGDYYPCSSRAGGLGFPIARDLKDPGWLWGSRHPHLCLFAFGDGSVRQLSIHTNAEVLGYMCDRADGHVFDGEFW